MNSLAADQRVDFTKHVQPILARHCVACHGPDKQEGGLRLDVRALALHGGDSYAPAIRPGKSADSPLFQFISRGDADLQMPPKGPRLMAGEIEVLRRWIDDGAEWPRDASVEGDRTKTHWAFQRLKRPAVPTSNVPVEAVRNPIDQFIAVKLAERNLTPSPEADRRTLIRRLSFDVLGLPPSPEAVIEFVQDPDHRAYEKLVDTLLDSPHFGERWARHWLDVVRFAESHGFEMNQPRPNAWRYRDYVIRSFNDDLPYDQFVREQIAGDFYGVDEAMGFLVGGPWDQVKSPDPVLTAQQRADELHDIVSTTGSVFLGLTVGCARCHSHKFDPIPQTDYYALKACFEGVQHGDRELRLEQTAEQQQQLAAGQAELKSIDAELNRFEPVAAVGQSLLIRTDDSDRTRSLQPPQGPAISPGTERGATDYVGNATDLPTLSRGYLYWQAPPGTDVFAWKPQLRGEFRIWVSWGCGWPTHAKDARYVLDLDGKLATREDQTEILCVDQQRFADGTGDLPKQALWSGFRNAGRHELTAESILILRQGQTDSVLTADVIVFQQDDRQQLTQPRLRSPVSRDQCVDRFDPVAVRFLRFSIAATNSGSEPCLDELEVFADGRNVALGASGAKVTASGTLPGFAIHKLEHLSDGRYGNDWSWISDMPGRGWVQIKFSEPVRVERVVWSRDRSVEPRFTDRVPTAYRIEVSTDGGIWQTVASSEDRLPYGTKVPGGKIHAAPGPDSGSDALPNLLSRRAAIQGKMAALSQMPVVYAGKLVQPGPTMRLHRGDPTQPREPIAPGSLSAISDSFRLSADASEQQRRLELAQWITSPQNPLTARVIVNRIWQHYFGNGIVNTPSDVGINGGMPSHPELLDWLASELIAGSASPIEQSTAPRPWTLKRIHRLLLLSGTYRRLSTPRSDGLAVDAANRLLWRYSPRRLEAEPLRDTILAVSGKLDRRMGGVGFDLFEPNTNYVRVYTPKRTFGPEDFRRMIYQTKPRMKLEDTFGAFDCPDAGQVTPQRSSSTTPLQALNLLNSPFLIEQSRFFAERIHRDAGDDPMRQVCRAFQLAFQRDPLAHELDSAIDLVKSQGLLVFCRALFNANEFLMVF